MSSAQKTNPKFQIVTHSFSSRRFVFFMYMNALSSYSLEDGTRSHYRWLCATMWLLGIELGTSGRVASALNL